MDRGPLRPLPRAQGRAVVALIDVLEAKDIDQIEQVLLGALDRLKEIVQELRDETKVRIIIEFERKEKS